MTQLKHIWSVLFLFVAFAVLESCSVNPVTGKRQLAISEQKELEMGAAYDPQVVAQYGLYQDQELQQFIETRGKEMAAVSERPNLPWSFKVVDSPVVNAFAVPGGYVYFTRGIMAHFNNEAQFAGVLGHEIGHVTARHTANQIAKQQVYQGALIGGMILSSDVAQNAQLASQGLGLLFLKFGRDAERQSDRLGVKYSTTVGYDATEMAGFFKTLESLSGGPEGGIPNFVSTHPNPGERYETVLQLAQQAKAKAPNKNYEVDRRDYLQMIDGIVYGEDPRGGYVENNNFYHPELKFQFPVPNGWQYQNSPSQFIMAEPNGRGQAVLQLAQGATSPEQAAQAFVQQNQLQVTGSQNITMSGLNATVTEAVVSTQAQQGQPAQQIGVLAYHIAYGDLIYRMYGLSSAQNYTGLRQTFVNVFGNFKPLNDPDKLNRQPMRLRIRQVPSAMSFQQAMQQFGQDGSKMQELAILNGKNPNDQLAAGSYIKTIGN